MSMFVYEAQKLKSGVPVTQTILQRMGTTDAGANNVHIHVPGCFSS